MFPGTCLEIDRGAELSLPKKNQLSSADFVLLSPISKAKFGLLRRGAWPNAP